MPRRVAESAYVLDYDSAKKRIAPNGNKLPDPISEGEILTDSSGTAWKLGRSIGIGGFGEIYLASDDILRNVPTSTPYAIKVEQYSNGPLFVEKNFYIRTAKPHQINEWKRQKKLKHLGISRYFGSGSHVYRGERYRFLVIDRFGQDLGKLFLQHKKRFHIKTVLYLGIQILDALEYIHSHGYVHADIKASNLILGRTSESQRCVYLVDFGLACKYRDKNGVHKDYRPDMRKAHAGTMEYTSRDAHIGAYSRRGDLEILGYNLLQWLLGSLPWEENLSDGDSVLASKNSFMANIPVTMRRCFADQPVNDVVSQYLKYVSTLSFDATPDYAYCQRLLRSGINDAGFVDDGKLEFGSSTPALLSNKMKKKSLKRGPAEEPENIGGTKPKKIMRVTPRQPCVAHNLNRMTRNSHAPIVLRSQQFDWGKVLSSNPEKQLKKTSRTVSRADPPSPLCAEEAPPIEPDSPYRPTPAMLSVLARRKERNSTSSGAALRKTRSDSSRSSSPLLDSSFPFGPLTYAMEEVLKRKEELAAHAHEALDYYCDDSYNSTNPIRVLRSGIKVPGLLRRCSPRLKSRASFNFQLSDSPSLLHTFQETILFKSFSSKLWSCWKLQNFRKSFTRNKEKSHGAKSGECGGWFNTQT